MSATVLPPVFGPVMTSALAGGTTSRSLATGSVSRATRPSDSGSRRATAGISSGWRACRNSSRPSCESAGRTPLNDIEHRALAWITSSSVAAASVACSSAAPTR